MKAIIQSLFCFLILLLPVIFQSCQGDEPIVDEQDIFVMATHNNIDENTHLLEALETATSELISLTLTNEVSVQHSDEEKLVLVVTGSGSWPDYGNVSMQESRVINIADRSSVGEGVLKVEGFGDLYYTTQCSRYPLPGSGSVNEWTMQMLFYDGTGEFKDVTGTATYTILQTGQSFMQETATLEGRLNNG